MILFPNAKINLGLDIIRRRPDGYHDISTVMIPVNWCDILEITPAKTSKSTLTVSGHHIDCHTEKNLVMKAYRKLETEYDLPPVDIYLRKIIPDGAGLGGGSADAAFMIKGLNELFGIGLNNEKMAEIAATLGADCPFFIYNQPMLCTGTGTDMSTIDLDIKGLRLCIIKPTRSVSTAQAYAGVTPISPVTPLKQRITSSITTWKTTVHNAFETSVGELLPEIATIKKEMYDAGAIYSSMSGSGSAVYGIWQNDILAENLHALFPDYTIHPCILE